MTKPQPQVLKDTIKTILTLSNEIQTQKKFLEDVIKCRASLKTGKK